MIARCQEILLEQNLKEHLKKHGSKYLALGALGLAHLARGDSEEVKSAAEQYGRAHQKLTGHIVAAHKAEEEGANTGRKIRIQKDIARASKETSEAEKKLLQKHPLKTAAKVGVGALAATALAKRAEEKKRQEEKMRREKREREEQIRKEEREKIRR